MRFPNYFKRGVGATAIAAGNKQLGTDTTPVITTRSIKNEDNVMSHRLSRPLKRIVIGYWYEGVGAIVTLPVVVYAFDENSQLWYQASSGTLTNKQLTYLRIPSLDDPPQTSANMMTPGHGLDAMVVIADNASGDGVCHFVAGPCSAEF